MDSPFNDYTGQPYFSSEEYYNDENTPFDIPEHFTEEGTSFEDQVAPQGTPNLVDRLSTYFKISKQKIKYQDGYFNKSSSAKFIALIKWAASEVQLNPGLVAINMVSEISSSFYLGGKVSSFAVGTDDFYENRHRMNQRVPAYKKINWFRDPDHLTDINEKGRELDTVFFKTGKDAALASAVYLKYGEVILREEAARLGKKFEDIPPESQLCFLRLAFNAGHGRAKKNLREFLQKNIPVLIKKPAQRAGPQRRATWVTAQSIHVADAFFGTPIPVVLNETEDFINEVFSELPDDEVFEELTTVEPTACSIDPKKENAIGFEFDMLLGITGDLNKTGTLANKEQISAHKYDVDGFKLTIGGNKIELATKPFALSDAGLTDLKATFKRINELISDIRSNLNTHRKKVNVRKDTACSSCLAGEGIYMETSDVGSALKIKASLVSTNHFILPLKTAVSKKKDYYTYNTTIRGVPQATMGIPLAAVNQLVNIIKSSQGKGIGIALTAAGSGIRSGLRSDALYNAQYRVNNARRFFLKSGSFNSLVINESNFSDTLTGFLILLVEYFWTSVLPDDRRDTEIFSKAYVPLHVKNRFRELFHCLLNDAERELFIKVFWENDNWKNLFSLTKKIDGRPGGYTDINTTASTRLFPSKIAVTKPTWKEFVKSIVENNFVIEQPTGNNTLVTGPTKAIPLTAKGVVVELRRMGFSTLSSAGWELMAVRLFSIAKKLNDADPLAREIPGEAIEFTADEEDELDIPEYDTFSDEEEQDVESELYAGEEEVAFEQFVPPVSVADLKQRIDDFMTMAKVEYTFPDGTVVRARSQFRYGWKGQHLAPEAAKSLIKKTLRSTSAGKKFADNNRVAIHYTAYGRPHINDIKRITQALIDVGELDKLRISLPGYSDGQLVRKLQRKFGIGIDCAGYVQLAFIYAYTGSEKDPKSKRSRLGLKKRRGDENLRRLSSTHFSKHDVVNAQAGDLLILKPRGNSEDNSGHTVIVFQHTVSGTVHTFTVDASWGTDEYGEAAGGIGRRVWYFDTASGEWWDKDPNTGSGVNRNNIGPYNQHPVQGLYRPKTKPGIKREVMYEDLLDDEMEEFSVPDYEDESEEEDYYEVG